MTSSRPAPHVSLIPSSKHRSPSQAKTKTLAFSDRCQEGVWASLPASPSPPFALPACGNTRSASLSTQPGWGPRIGTGPGASWRVSVSSECWPPPSLALPFYPTMHWAGLQAKGLTVLEWGPSSAGGEQTAPCPGQELCKVPSMSSCGRNAACFTEKRFVPKKGDNPNEKPPPATLKPQDPLSLCLCNHCCPHFLPS